MENVNTVKVILPLQFILSLKELKQAPSAITTRERSKYHLEQHDAFI